MNKLSNFMSRFASVVIGSLLIWVLVSLVVFTGLSILCLPLIPVGIYYLVLVRVYVAIQVVFIITFLCIIIKTLKEYLTDERSSK